MDVKKTIMRYWNSHYGPGVRVTAINRNVTFTDNTLNTNEGVNDLKVVFTRFAFFVHHHTTRTNTNGNFTSNVPNFGYVLMNLIYNNSKIRLRPADISNQTVAGSIFGILQSALLISLPASHLENLNPININNNVSINFPHGSKKALWSITYNGIQEANQYTINTNMRANQGATKFLDVMCCYYRNDGKRSSAPMLHYIGYFPTGANLLFNLVNIPSMAGNSLPGILPDLWIAGNLLDPDDSHILRATIYHEYGHSLHYFKANTVNNDHWKININHSAVSILPNNTNYGDHINTIRGSYFALSEGWAEYIGQLFGSMKYGNRNVFNGTRSTDGTVWLYIETAPYQTHLENNPTFANSFIPKGLFFDLTDAGNNEPFDFIQGFTTNDIYQMLNPTLPTIQHFRDAWEITYPNTNNADLFNFYNIN